MELYNKENASPTILNSFAEELEQGMKQGIEQGKTEGKLEERHAIARKLVLQNMPLEKVAEITELTMEEIKKIRKTSS